MNKGGKCLSFLLIPTMIELKGLLKVMIIILCYFTFIIAWWMVMFYNLRMLRSAAAVLSFDNSIERTVGLGHACGART